MNRLLVRCESDEESTPKTEREINVSLIYSTYERLLQPFCLHCSNNTISLAGGLEPTTCEAHVVTAVVIMKNYVANEQASLPAGQNEGGNIEPFSQLSCIIVRFNFGVPASRGLGSD